MDNITPIGLFDGELDEPFTPNPDDYETHTLIGDSIRGNVGDVVQVHKNDLAILRANKLIAAEGEETPTAAEAKAAKAAQAKAEKAAKAAQAKAEADAPAPQTEPVAELAAIPNIADMPGV